MSVCSENKLKTAASLESQLAQTLYAKSCLSPRAEGKANTKGAISRVYLILKTDLWQLFDLDLLSWNVERTRKGAKQSKTHIFGHFALLYKKDF